jgi:hypothetical protein
VTSQPWPLTLALAMLSTTGYSSAGTQTGNTAKQSFALLGTVDMQDADLPKDVPLVPVTFDARFVIRVRIDKVLVGESPWKEGATVAFLIHSPSRMFGRHNVKGEQFRFTFAVEKGPVAERDCRYCITALAKAE